MEDRELMKIAAFKLQESAKRMATLAHEAGAPAVRGRLSSLSQELLEHARKLELLDPSSPGRRAPELPAPLDLSQSVAKRSADLAD